MIGFGYDSHRFGGEKKLILGGVSIDSTYGIIAHSDGDALIHALVDSLLGATGKGDIGEIYPDYDSKNKDRDSTIFLIETIAKLNQEKYKITNIDVTIILEKPKLSEYKSSIRENLATLCKLTPEKINIKAKTNEKMGFIGRNEGIAVFCVTQVEKAD